MRAYAIGGVLVLNLAAVLQANLPPLPASMPRPVEWAGWALRRYAHAAGLDARWSMFSTVHRFDWGLVPLVQDRGGDWTEAPEGGFDPNRAKLHLNLYADARGRRAYARQLCRESRGDAARAAFGVWRRPIPPPGGPAGPRETTRELLDVHECD